MLFSIFMCTCLHIQRQPDHHYRYRHPCFWSLGTEQTCAPCTNLQLDLRYQRLRLRAIFTNLDICGVPTLEARPLFFIIRSTSLYFHSCLSPFSHWYFRALFFILPYNIQAGYSRTMTYYLLTTYWMGTRCI